MDFYDNFQLSFKVEVASFHPAVHVASVKVVTYISHIHISSHILQLGSKILLITVLPRSKAFMQGATIDPSHIPSLGENPLLVGLWIGGPGTGKQRVFIA